MKKSFWHSRTSIILIAVITALLTVTALICFTVANSNRITDENREYLLDSAVQMADSVDSALTAGYDNIALLGHLVSRSLVGPNFDVARTQSLISNSVFDFMEFADKDGMDHNITGGVSDARDRQYYLDAKAGNSGMELIYVSRATHETLLMYYTPLYYGNAFVGSLIGVYQASNRLTELLSATYFGEAATSWLATDTGRIIACSDGFDPTSEMYMKDLAGGDPVQEAAFDKAFATGETVTFQPEENRTGGCVIRLPESGWYLIHMFPAKASSHMISEANRLGLRLFMFLATVYVIVMITLIIFYRHQQKQVETAKDQAEQANRAKTDFLFNMSHDIRTPMNAIIGYTNIAKKSLDNPARVSDCLNKTGQAGNLLLSLINSILDMSRIESGQARADESQGDVLCSFVNIESTLNGLARAKGITLTFAYGEIPDRYVWCDIDRCVRVLMNLITNAIKYTRPGGSVSVRCEEVGKPENGVGTYRYTVADNGIGMSREFVSRAFDEFAREENSTTSGIQGTGLGLSVVRTFVGLMNGTVTCESEQGVGSTFTVTLPFRLREADESDRKIGPVAEAPAVETDRSRFRGKHVLLVEDNQMNREIAVDLLEEVGLAVDTAVDGSVAVRLLKENGPDAYDFVLMDIQMPVMGGYDATETIRKMYPDSSLPIIALSANAFSEDRDASIAAGMNDHIAKPIDVNRLFAVLDKYLK